MTFGELKAELLARGFTPLTDARLGALINRARSRIDSMHLWEYREDSVEAVAPISIPALGTVEAVSNETQGYILEQAGYGDLVNWGCDLAQAGSPEFWYKATPGGVPVIATWPSSSSDLIGVQYWAITADMVDDSDEPDMPARFHGLIVDIATQMAERERGNYQQAESFQPDIDRQVALMVEDLISQNEPVHQRVSDASTDW